MGKAHRRTSAERVEARAARSAQVNARRDRAVEILRARVDEERAQRDAKNLEAAKGLDVLYRSGLFASPPAAE